VEEGAVGAGTGTSAFGWKGGIGTSSRVLPGSAGGYAVGVLVQSNFGGVLQIAGAPVGKELGRYAFRGLVEPPGPGREGEGERAGDSGSRADSNARPDSKARTDSEARILNNWEEREGESQGSIMIVVATDAPLSERNLARLARRAVMGLSRTGSFASNGSGDYVIAFSTASQVRRLGGERVRSPSDLVNSQMSPLFQATVEATEEAIYNSLFMAVTVRSRWGEREALPIEATLEVLRKYGVIAK